MKSRLQRLKAFESPCIAKLKESTAARTLTKAWILVYA